MACPLQLCITEIGNLHIRILTVQLRLHSLVGDLVNTDPLALELKLDLERLNGLPSHLLGDIGRYKDDVKFIDLSRSHQLASIGDPPRASLTPEVLSVSSCPSTRCTIADTIGERLRVWASSPSIMLSPEAAAIGVHTHDRPNALEIASKTSSVMT